MGPHRASLGTYSTSVLVLVMVELAFKSFIVYMYLINVLLLCTAVRYFIVVYSVYVSRYIKIYHYYCYYCDVSGERHKNV